MALVLLPYMYIPDPTRGRPIFNGKIYIGEPDTDPKIVSNQKSANLVQEDGTTVPASYPILTNSGGVPIYNGSPVAIDVNGAFSIAIDDRNDDPVYYFPSNGTESNFVVSDLRSIMFDLGLGYSDIGTIIVTSESGVSLDDAEYLLDLSSGQVWLLPSNIPPSSTVSSVSGSTLTTNNGQFEMKKKQDDVTQEVSPRNNQWNGYLNPEHQSSLTAPNGYPATSGGGGAAYSADQEISYGIFAGSGGATVSSDSDGWIISAGSIYRLYTYTIEQLADIDVNAAPIFIKDEAGNSYYVNNSTTGVTVSKPDTTTLRVEIDSSIFAELGITKMWRWFDTEKIGYIPELSPSQVYSVISKYLESLRDWVDELSGRTSGVAYTNNTGCDMIVSVTSQNLNAVRLSIYVDGSLIQKTSSFEAGVNTDSAAVVATVKHGSSYVVNAEIGSFSDWKEYKVI